MMKRFGGNILQLISNLTTVWASNSTQVKTSKYCSPNNLKSVCKIEVRFDKPLHTYQSFVGTSLKLLSTFAILCSVC